MSIRKVQNGWLLNEQPGGRKGKQIKRIFKTKREAERFREYIWQQYESGQPWNPDQKDKRKLNELIEEWYQLHGINLKDGKSRKRVLQRLSSELNNPTVSELSITAFINYRNKKIESGLTPTTLNRQLSYLKAVYNKLAKYGLNVVNPLSSLAPIKQDEKELAYLTTE